MRSSLKAGAVAAIASLALAAPAAAKTYVVTKQGDPSPNGCKKKNCSLREAVIAANAHAGADKVLLPTNRTYALFIPNSDPNGEDEAVEGDLDVTGPLRIAHPGRGRADVEANGIDRVFDVHAGAPTKIKKLVIAGGESPPTAEAQGGGIRTDADLTIVRSVVRGNHASGGDGAGGGISARDGLLRLRRTAVVRNIADDSSGAIEVDNDGVDIARSKLIGNDASFAGASYMYGEGASRITKSTIAGNSSTGETGGIYFSESEGSMVISDSTISENSSETDGGGLTGRNGQLTVVNSTIADNHAGGNGGGIWAFDPVTLNAVTVVRNSALNGGGLYHLTTAPFEVTNSLIALNSATGLGDDCGFEEPGDELDSLGHNLLGTDADCEAFDATGDFVNSNPKLGQLKSNGGPTQTVALKKGSPAINKAGDSAPNKDQRGKKRGKKPDIGAYERVKKKRKKRR